MLRYTIDIGKIILKKLKEQGRSVAWLAEKIGHDKSNLNKILNSSQYISFDLVLNIGIAMGVNFFSCGGLKQEEILNNG